MDIQVSRDVLIMYNVSGCIRGTVLCFVFGLRSRETLMNTGVTQNRPNVIKLSFFNKWMREQGALNVQWTFV